MEDKQEIVNLEDSTKEVVNDIVNTNNPDEFKDLVSLFNLNQSKKNALRIVKLNGLLEQLEDKIIERFNKKPEQMSNQDLLDFLKAIEGSIDRSQKYVNEVESKPMIQFNQQNNINIDSNSTLDRDAKERVIETIKAILGGNPDTSSIIDEPISEVIVQEIDETSGYKGENDDNN